MKYFFLIFLLLISFALPVAATDISPPEVPISGEKYMPEDTESFAEGLWYVIKSSLHALQPSIAEASGVCLSLVAVVILVSVVSSISGSSKTVLDLVSTLLIGIILTQPANSMIRLGTETVTEMTEYGKLLLPVMTTALAAQGAPSTSAALYTATSFFSTILSTAVARLIIPMLYIFLVLCIANSALGEDLLAQLKKFIKWSMTWGMKILLYVFTGFLGVTGVVSGSADAAAVKAAKLAISGVVPVVGNIISDASETILVSISAVKNAVGIYGILALCSVFVAPFMQIGCQYLMLKLTAAVCDIFGCKKASGLVHDFAGGMGLILGMTGMMCLFLLISTVCFMKGVS